MSALRLSITAVIALGGLESVWAWPTIGAAASHGALEFEGSRLGMSLRDWQAVPTPPGAGPDAIPICNDQDRTIQVPGYPLSAREVADGVVVCSFKARFGHDVETHSVDIGDGFRAYNLAYVFRRRRLDEIRFTASTDAYGHIRSILSLGGRSLRPAAFPAKITAPREWRVKGHRVRIAPGPDAAMLAVDMRR